MLSSISDTPLPQRKAWTSEEDHKLQELRQTQNLDWIEVAREIGGRNPSQCAQRWKRIKGFKLRRQWTSEEDNQLKDLVEKYGFHWSKISPFLNQRSGKQIREHYLNQLRPDLNTAPWNVEEDEKIIKIYKEVGGRWSVIQKQLKGRSENSIKNRFYSFLRNKYLNIKNPYYVIPEKSLTKENKQELKFEQEVKQQLPTFPSKIAIEQQSYLCRQPQFYSPMPIGYPSQYPFQMQFAMVMPFFMFPQSQMLPQNPMFQNQL